MNFNNFYQCCILYTNILHIKVHPQILVSHIHYVLTHSNRLPPMNNTGCFKTMQSIWSKAKVLCSTLQFLFGFNNIFMTYYFIVWQLSYQNIIYNVGKGENCF